MAQGLEAVARALGATNADALDWGALRYEQLRGVPAKLAATLAPRTVNTYLSALRGALEVAWRLGELPDDAYRKIEFKNLKVSSLPAGRALSDAEVTAVSAALEKEEPRDAALLVAL